MSATSSCISYSIDCIELLTYYYYYYLLLLIAITVSITLYQKCDLLLSFLFLQSLFSTWATELLIASPVVDISQAVVLRCSVKKLFQEISQNSQENICTRDSFLMTLQPYGQQLYFKKSLPQVFSCEFCKISKNTFFREHLRWLLLLFDRTLDMAYELNRRKNVCIFEM